MVSPLERNAFVKAFRWIALALVVFYWAHQWLINDYSHFGLQFRYLTIWGLTLSLICVVLMVLRSTGQTDNRPDVLVSMTVVVNVMVVYLYWSIYFDDPSSVNGGNPIPWWRELYLHLGVQIIHAIDALFIFGAFRKPLKTAIASLAIMFAFVLWMEVPQRMLNDRPQGTVTSGLPYPFLNDMTFNERLIFDGTTIATGLVLTVILSVVAWGLRKVGIPRD